MRMSAAVRAAKRVPLLQVAKSAAATMAAWLIAGWLIPGPPPVFAAIAALLVVQPSLDQSFLRAIERTIGVVAGVIIASALGIAFGTHTWVVLLTIGLALLVAWVFKMTPGTSNQVAISGLLVLSLGATTPNYAVDRIIETIIGALVGIVVNVLIVPPIVVAPARASVEGLGTELAASLDRLADAFEGPRSRAELEELLLKVRLMKPMREATDKAMTAAADSLTLNPRARAYRDELARLSALLDRFTPIITQVGGMTRAFYDHYDRSITDEPVVRAIAEQLHRAAHDVRLVLRQGVAESTASTDGAATADGSAPAASVPDRDIPALTTPLVIEAPSFTNWILIGSLLEDLRRIHEALGQQA